MFVILDKNTTLDNRSCYFCTCILTISIDYHLDTHTFLADERQKEEDYKIDENKKKIENW